MLDTPFSRWLDRFFDAYYRLHPVTATFIGAHDHDHRLPDASPEALDSALAETRDHLKALEPIPGEGLDEAQAIDRDLAEGFLRIQEWELTSRHLAGNPAWYTGEAVFGMFSLLFSNFAPVEERVELLRKRMASVPRWLEEGRANVGQDAPLRWVERAAGECDSALRFLQSGLPLVSESAGERLQTERGEAVRAFEAFRDHLSRAAALDATRRPSACGDEGLRLVLDKGHFLGESPHELRERAEAFMKDSLEALDETEGEWRESLKALENLHPSRDRYYESFADCWQASRRHAEAHRLLSWPEHPIRFVPRPLWSRAAAPGLYFLFYRSPAPLDPVSRHDYLLAPLEPDLDDAAAERLLRACNWSVIKLNHVVHHGGIGHHAQNAFARRAPSRVGRVAAVDGASRIAMTAGGTMAEGWACYATDLMDETGFLTPLESVAQRHAHVRMGARTVVDVSLHLGEMTPDEAERFYVREASLSEGSARAEVTKNSMFPGAAVIYFAGTSAIHELRREIASREGSEHDLRSFHDRVLSYGSIPVSSIRERMLAAST